MSFLVYLVLSFLIGYWNYSRGWSFMNAFLVSLIFTPVLGLLFTFIRGHGPMYDEQNARRFPDNSEGF